MQLDPIGELSRWFVMPATIAIVAILYVLLRRMLFTPYIAVLEVAPGACGRGARTTDPGRCDR